MANPIEYIVFEADQVLTNDHLNETFNYLDQQDRWTRNKLIGIGIVCGLNITQNPGVIAVSKGCGVTSQGYLITQDAAQYTYYMPYSAVDVPNDLPFQYPNGDLPFYKPFCTGKQVWLLLTDDQFSLLETAQQLTASTISSAAANFLGDYVVALFLEMTETDLKNCDMLDCNNKGERMTLQVRPLLVAKKDLPGAVTLGNIDSSFLHNIHLNPSLLTHAALAAGPTLTASPVLTAGPVLTANPVLTATPILPINPILINPILNLGLAPQVSLKRFNVPYSDLNDADDVINAFANLVDDDTLTQLASALNNCYTNYNSILNISINPFTALLTTLQGYRNNILQNNPVFIEYFYDFIDDLIKAFNEFMAKVVNVITTCCPDENLFPLHLILGDAALATNSLVKDTYRNYFMYSPLFAKMGSESSEVLFLFNRIVIMVQQFTTQAQTQTSTLLLIRQLINIKITPSQYQKPWLSDRAIPYYYNVNVSGSELYKSWNYYKTINGQATLNLGFNSNQYNNRPAVTQPLLYDIEQYNFFRVEGHIGLNYQTVLSNLLNQRLSFNLPFDVMAISADLLSSTAALPQCNFQDLETGYKLILSEAACKIHTTFCFITKMPYTPPARSPILTGVFEASTLNLVKSVSTGIVANPVVAAHTANSPHAAKTPAATIPTGITTVKGDAPILATGVGVNQPVGTGVISENPVLGTGVIGQLPPGVISANPVVTAGGAASTTGATIDTTNAINFSTFKLNLAATLEPVLALTAAYKKGDFMRTYCTPLANTIGSGYMNALSSTGVFTNPIQIDQGNPLTIAYYYFFQYVDAVEQLMYVLQTNTLDTIDMTAFGQQYLGYLGITTLTISFLTAMAEQNAAIAANGAAATPFVTLAEDLQLDMLTAELDVLTSICIDERLQVLKDEYTRRLTQYQQQHTFINYYKNHPGLEHKGGVPKGGTLVLVYHTAPATTPTPTGPILTGPILTGPILTGPILTNPVATNPVLTNPVTTNPVTTNPVLTNPVITDPVLTNPVVTNPVITNPVITNPVTTNPVLTNPVTTNPVATNPVLTNPVTTNPVATNPVLTNPVTTGPVATNPVLTNPVLTNPVTTNPVLTNPVLTNPVKTTGPVLNSPVITHRALASKAIDTTILANPVLTGAILNHPVATVNPTVSAAPIFDASTLNLLKTYVNNLQDTPDNQKQLLINILANQPVQQLQPIYQIDDGAIIADFYIPYLCCSDCPPTAYIVPPPPAPVQDKPVITMATTFCDNDTKGEPVAVSAPGGTFNTVKGLDGVKMVFIPATAGAGTYSIVYTLNGVDSDPVSVTVLPTPVSTFKFASQFVNDVLQATFTPDSQDKAFSYKWTFGAGFSPQASTDAVPVLKVTIDPTGAQTQTFASLIVSNGNCQVAQAVNVVLAISPNGVFQPAAAGGNIKTNAKKAAAVKKPAAKGSAAKEAPAKKTVAKSVTPKAVPAKKAVAPKATTKEGTAKTAPVKPAPVKKAPAKKVSAKAAPAKTAPIRRKRSK